MIQSTPSATNLYYMSPVGSDANSGLSPAAPIRSIAKALAIAQTVDKNFVRELIFNLLPGVYLEPDVELSANALVGVSLSFIGPDVGGSPNVPTVIIQGTSDGSRVSGSNAFRCSVGAVVNLENIFFQSYDTAFPAAQGGRINLTNIHTKNCKIVGSCGNGGYITVNGGNWDGRDMGNVMIADSIGFRAVIVSACDLEQNDYASGCKIHHFDRGAVFSEASSGHMDFLLFEDCNLGVEITRGSGCPNMIPIRMRRCTTPILSRGVFALLLSDTLDFGYGTADACGPIVMTDAAYSGSIDATNNDSRRVLNVHSNNGGSELTGSTAEVSLWSNPVKLLPGRVREGDCLQFDLYGICSGGLVADMTIRVKFDGVTPGETVLIPAGASRWQIEADFHVLSDTDVRGQIKVVSDAAGAPGGVNLYTVITSTVINPAAPTQVNITKQAGDVADSIQLSFAYCASSVAGVTVN